MGDKILYIGGMRMDMPWVIDNTWINLSRWTGRGENTLPKHLREPDDYLVHISSLMSVIGDATCDPRSGGLAGYVHIASFYGVAEQQFRRNIAPTVDYLAWMNNIPITHVESAAADGLRYRTEINGKRRANLKQFASDRITNLSSKHL